MGIKRVLSSLNLGSIRGFLTSLYHGAGPGRKPYDPVSVLKAQLLKHLLRVPSDRRLALLLKRDRKVAKACGFRRKTPSHGLFTHFRHRLGRDGYEKVFSMLLKQLVEDEVVKGEVVAIDSTAVKAYSQRGLKNKRGKSDPEAKEELSKKHLRQDQPSKKPRRRQEDSSEPCIPNVNSHQTEKNEQRNPKKTATTRSIIISKQPSARVALLMASQSVIFDHLLLS